MPEATSMMGFVAAALVAAVVPGPTVAVVVSSGLARGVSAGLASVLGGQAALLLMTMVLALGLEAVLAFMGWAFDLLRLLGAAYLVWMGWRTFSARGGLAFGPSGPPRRLGAYGVQGFLVVAANPKTLLFFGAFLPQFVDRNEPVAPQVIVYGLLAMAVALFSDGAYAVAAGRARHLLDAARLRLVNRLSGAALMAGGFWLALQRRA